MICLITFLMIFFETQKLLIFHIFFLLFLVYLVPYLRNHCLTQCHEDVRLLSSVCFMGLALTFRSLIDFELLLTDGMRQGCFILLYISVQFPSIICLKKPLFPFFIFHYCQWKSTHYKWVDFLKKPSTIIVENCLHCSLISFHFLTRE